MEQIVTLAGIVNQVYRETDSPLGFFRLNHTNESDLFLTYVAINNLKVAATSFKKKHSSMKQETSSDWPFIVNNEMFHRVKNVGSTPQLLDSDH